MSGYFRLSYVRGMVMSVYIRLSQVKSIYYMFGQVNSCYVRLRQDRSG
jgi:hypothetical protein